jgi:hypothetical protein
LDQQQTMSYLVATTRDGRRLYERHGYQDFGEVCLPDGGPPMWPMWREPIATVALGGLS